MGTKEILKGSAVYLISFLAVLLVLSPPRPEAAEPGKFSQAVEVKDNLVAVNARDVELSSLLKEIGEKAGIKINIGKDLTGKKVTARFDNLDVEDALRRILGTNYLFVLTKEQTEDKYTLKEVSVVGSLPTKPTQEKMTTLNIAYGSGKQEIGVITQTAHVGPYLFAVDDKDNIYVLDTVNKRVQVFSRDGAFLSTIPLGGVFGIDIAIDRRGFLYVRNVMPAELIQYDQRGNALTRIPIDERRWIGGGEMYITDDGTVYGSGCARELCGDIIVGKVVDGSLVEAPSEELNQPPKGGRYGLSGRRYDVVQFLKGEKFEIQIIEKDGRPSELISIPLNGVVDLDILGDDVSGNFYIRTSRLDRNIILEEIHKFSSEGRYLSSISVSNTGNYFKTTRNYLVSRKGTIYDFSPQAESLRLGVLWVLGN